MKFSSLFFSFFLAATSMVVGQIAVNGVDNDGFIGVYEIEGQYYWWLCIEPNGTPAAISGEAFLADEVSLLGGWDQQNTERQTAYAGDLAFQAALSKQVSVMQYVLDAYLPISTLTTPGALLLGSENAAHYDNNEAFYNSMNVVQNFLSELYGKPAHTDFTNLGDFADRWSGDLSEAGIARSTLYQSLLNDVADKDAANFFDTYVVVNDYYIANTLFPEADVDNWQDALIIAIPVPEPGGALLIGCFGLAIMFRRWRRLA